MQRYIDEMAVTGLTSNPTIFEKAIGDSAAYDDSIRKAATAGKSGQDLFFDLALEDLTRAADPFRRRRAATASSQRRSPAQSRLDKPLPPPLKQHRRRVAKVGKSRVKVETELKGKHCCSRW